MSNIDFLSATTAPIQVYTEVNETEKYLFSATGFFHSESDNSINFLTNWNQAERACYLTMFHFFKPPPVCNHAFPTLGRGKGLSVNAFDSLEASPHKIAATNVLNTIYRISFF